MKRQAFRAHAGEVFEEKKEETPDPKDVIDRHHQQQNFSSPPPHIRPIQQCPSDGSSETEGASSPRTSPPGGGDLGDDLGDDDTEMEENDADDTGAGGSGEVEKARGHRHSRSGRSAARTLLRLSLVDLPLAVLFAMYVSTVFFQRIADEYLLPQLELAKFTPERAARELTYYHYKCREEDVTASEPAPLIVTPDMSSQDCLEHMIRHGAQVHPNLLTAETAAEVREFILEQNLKGQDMIDVIENKNRWSFRIRVDQHPAVGKALREILSKRQLVEALEAIVGKDPAVIEFTGITSAYGAETQFMHQDVVTEGNGAKYGRNFVPSYSLFIPVQNVTKAMGATDICPGTHMCVESASEVCDRMAFPMSGPDDNWPAGWGALVNQQTTHRGAAHVHRGGPHRVLFIVTFAPRPNFGPFSVETRQIGQGGSYSLHWSNWGHTLRDYQNPEVHMRQPWRTLRSMGLYKPPRRNWGWDYISQMTARIANGELGFYRSDLDKFLKKGGFWFLPANLQGDFDRKNQDSTVWSEFFQDTLNRCQEALWMAYSAVACLYLGGLVAVNALLILFGNRRHSDSTIAHGVRRALLSHAFVLAAAWLFHRRVSRGSWAHNIRAGRMYQIPHAKENPAALDVRASLPLREDVLVFDDMQSEYLASFTRVLDVFHPGNAAWNSMVTAHSSNYGHLPPGMRRQLASELARWAKRDQGRRLLVRNPNGNWGEPSERRARRLAHKALMKEWKPVVGELLTWTDYLFSETKYGYFRQSAMHTWHIPALLLNLEDRLLGLDGDSVKEGKAHKAVSTRDAAQTPMRMIILPSALTVPVPLFGRGAGIPRGSRGGSGIPPSRTPAVEPYPGAWAKEDDLVEAHYQSITQEWYRAYIQEACANSGKWDVEYEDGEEEVGLCQRCVRPWVDYKVGDPVDTRDPNEGKYLPGRIHGIRHESHGDTTFDVELDAGGSIHRVPYAELRRSAGQKGPVEMLEVGTRVKARYQGLMEAYPGVIVKVHPGGNTFDVLYDDGDFEKKVHRKYIAVDEDQRHPAMP